MADNDLATVVEGALFEPVTGVWDPALAAIAFQGIAAPTPPSITITPTHGSSITRTASVQVDVTDDSAALGDVTIWATLADGSTEIIWGGSAFSANFSGSTSPLALGTRFTFTYTGAGWPTTAVTVSAKAADPSGAQTGAVSATLTVSDPPAAPTITFSPVTGGSQTRAASVQVDVTSPDGAATLVLIQIHAVLADATERLVAFGSTVKAPFTAGSSRSSIANGYRYVVAWDAPGWPSTTAGLRVEAMNSYGQLTTATWSATVSDPPAPPDTTVPAVTFDPPLGTELQLNQPFSVTVTDPGILRRMIVRVTFPSGDYEDAWDGYAITPRYAAASSLQGVDGTGGKKLTVMRTGGWPAAPSPNVYAIDNAGNEA